MDEVYAGEYDGLTEEDSCLDQSFDDLKNAGNFESYIVGASGW